MGDKITEASLREALVGRLRASHVEINDISGKTCDDAIRHAYPLEEFYRQPISRDGMVYYRTGGCGQSFTALVVSDGFENLNTLKRHRLVNNALKPEIARIHAWTAKCKTPAEWEAENGAAAVEGERKEGEIGGKEEEGPPVDGAVDGRVEGVKE